ncbi:F-box only protein 36 isoform X2 [Rissa tridactyla]|uniref:F-box only protein 36 isoform X2 n=1 Tax=Rissa tridactyla TaxID=75485 RepID=UPI0023BA4CF3|nr:F-box only protein 36 isoform X2 [Rissa tridactyla]
MASLLGEEVFETRRQAPAPSKDFCQLLVTRREVVFRWWKISLRNKFRESRPGEIKESWEDFLDDSSLHIQIAIVFGAKVLEHVLNLCRGNYDFLERLPVPLLLYIISFLELEDIARLSQVSRRFEMAVWPKLCGRLLTIQEDMAVLLFLWCGYEDIIDALTRVSSSEHKK